MSAKHTPGPWKSEGHINYARSIEIYADDARKTHIAFACCSFPTSSNPSTPEFGDDTAIANAHLIAAAPQLYEALKQMLAASSSLVTKEMRITSRQCARAAIAAAEGRP